MPQVSADVYVPIAPDLACAVLQTHGPVRADLALRGEGGGSGE